MRLFRGIMAAAVGGLFLVLGSTEVKAVTIVAGIAFDDNAFADVVLGTSGSPTFERIVGPTVADRVSTTADDALLGSDLASMTIELNDNQSVSVGFTDNFIVNGVGTDLIIFEEFSGPEGGVIEIEIGGVAIFQSAVSMGMFDIGGGVTNYVNRIDIDLSDYGFAAGATASSLRAFGGASPNGSEYAVFAALNSAPIPEPTAPLLFGVGTLVVGSAIRRRAA